MRKSWQQQLAEGFAEPAELFHTLNIDPSHLNKVALYPFKLKVPQCFVNRMKKGDVNDPLLRQILPLKEESVSIPEFSQDPLQEKKFNPVPGLIHKYKNRVLLMPTGACAIHCRYCFRRYFPYEDNNPQANAETIVSYIQQHPEIDEVILSGGDPLVATDKTLKKWIARFDALSQLRTLRIHTRLPVVLPDRITDELISLLNQSRLQVVVIIHCNHPNEVDDSVSAALMKLTRVGITVLNQAVLLKGVNDRVETLIELNKKLFQSRVLPYYLFLLDKVSGTSHFEISESKAKHVWKGLQANLPGYLVPRLAREEVGEASKTWISGVFQF